MNVTSAPVVQDMICDQDRRNAGGQVAARLQGVWLKDVGV